MKLPLIAILAALPVSLAGSAAEAAIFFSEPTAGLGSDADLTILDSEILVSPLILPFSAGLPDALSMPALAQTGAPSLAETIDLETNTISIDSREFFVNITGVPSPESEEIIFDGSAPFDSSFQVFLVSETPAVFTIDTASEEGASIVPLPATGPLLLLGAAALAAGARVRKTRAKA